MALYYILIIMKNNESCHDANFIVALPAPSVIFMETRGATSDDKQSWHHEDCRLLLSTYTLTKMIMKSPLPKNPFCN